MMCFGAFVYQIGGFLERQLLEAAKVTEPEPPRGGRTVNSLTKAVRDGPRQLRGYQVVAAVGCVRVKEVLLKKYEGQMDTAIK